MALKSLSCSATLLNYLMEYPTIHLYLFLIRTIEAPIIEFRLYIRAFRAVCMQRKTNYKWDYSMVYHERELHDHFIPFHRKYIGQQLIYDLPSFYAFTWFIYVYNFYRYCNWLICHVNCWYVSVTNTKAYATLATEHVFSGYILFYLFSLFVFHVISVNIVNVIFCKKCITTKNLKSESNTIAATFSQGAMGRFGCDTIDPEFWLAVCCI